MTPVGWRSSELCGTQICDFRRSAPQAVKKAEKGEIEKGAGVEEDGLREGLP